MNPSDEEFAKRAKTVFDQSVDGLDAATLSKLNRGRQAALAAATPNRRQWLVWAPAGGVAAAALVAAVVMQNPTMQNPDLEGFETAAGDLEILLGEESIELFEELEFYAWLESADLEPVSDG